MRGLGIHKNIPVSDTKLTLVLLVGFISSHLTADKLFLISSREITCPSKMNLLLGAKSMPALIIKPRFILVAHTDDIDWNKTSNKQQQMLVQILYRIVSRPHASYHMILYCTTNGIKIDLMFKENFSTDAHVWNSLSHQNDCQQRGVIRVTYGCYNGNPNYRSGTSVIRRSSIPPLAWVGPTTN